jgi:hypothetical protein
MHGFDDATRAALASPAVAVSPPADLVLTPLQGDGRSLEDWLTTFHLASVVIDPYTVESAWVLDTAARILRAFKDAAVRVNFVVTAGPDDARAFLGPLAEEFLVFTDPDRAVVKAFGLTTLPAFVLVGEDGTVRAAAEGWSPRSWRFVAEAIATLTAWSKPSIPLPGDPAPFDGSPALG